MRTTGSLISISLEGTVDFKKARIEAHNNWPQIGDFKAEKAFRDLLSAKGDIPPFKTITLGHGSGKDYQIYVGHYVDGLEALPYRPDFLFDQSFKVVDNGAKILFPNLGIKGIAQGLAAKLLVLAPVEWQNITDELGRNMPLATFRYIVKRICSAHGGTDRLSKQFQERATNCFKSKFYNDFVDKFSRDDSGALSNFPSSKNIEKGASFLKLYMSGKVGTRTKAATHINLDLTQPNNLPSLPQRIEFIMSLLLFNMRNEHAHGAVASPFRSSKASLDRYESYYFSMLAAYIFSLGVLCLRNLGNINGTQIENCCSENVALLNSFFRT